MLHYCSPCSMIIAMVFILQEIFDRDNALALDLAVQLMKIQMKDDFDALAMAIHHMNENPMVHT